MKPLPLISVRKRRVFTLREQVWIRKRTKTLFLLNQRLVTGFRGIWHNPKQKKRLLVGSGLAALAITGTILFFFWPSTPDQFTFNPFRPGYVSARLPAANMLVEARTSGTPRFTLTRNKSQFEFHVPGESTVLSHSDSGSLTFRNKRNQEVRYQIQSNGIKEEIKLFEKPEENTFSTQIRVNNVVVKVAANGALYFYSRDGEYQFHVEAPFAQDAKGNTTWGVSYQILDENGRQLLQPLEKEVHKEIFNLQEVELHENYELQVVVNPQWLQSEERQYPIIIDPTVIHDTSTEFGSGTMDRTSFEGLSGDSSTIAYWALNETSNATCSGGADACDTSGSSLHLTQSNTTIMTTGQNKGEAARTFNGTSSTLGRTSAPTTSLDNWTIEAWVKPTTLPQASMIVYNGNDTGGYGFGISNGTGTSGSKLTGLFGNIAWIDSGYTFPTANVWYHVIMTRKNGTTSFYVNGTQTSGTSSSSPAAVQSRFSIGMQFDPSNAPYRYFTGAVDDVSVLTRGITPSEASASYSTGVQSAYQELSADAHTVGLWHMNEGVNNTCAGGSNDVCDKSGKNNDGAFQSTTAFTSSAHLGSHAVTTGGTSNYIRVPNSSSLNPTNQITVEAWVKTTSTAASIAVVSKATGCASTGYLLWLNQGSIGAGIPSFWIGAGAWLDGTSAINDGNWHHVAGVFDGSTAYLYVDGVLTNSAARTGSLVSTTDLGIGGSVACGNAFGGDIDEVRISDIARSAEDISATASRSPSSTYTSPAIDLTTVTSYNNLSWTEHGVATGDGETLSDTTSLVAQWNLNNTSGTTATNNAGSCGATCNGTLTNFASTGSQDAAAQTGWTTANARWGNGALMFDGVDDYVAMGSTFSSITDTFTLEFWANPNKTRASTAEATSGIAGSTGQSYALWPHAYSGSPDGGVGAGVSVGTNGISVFEHAGGYLPSLLVYDAPIQGWNHIVVVYNNKQPSLYVNGRLVKTGLTSSYSVHPGGTYLGDAASGYGPYRGSLDTTRIYSRALSASEIAANAQAGNIQFQTRSSADGSTWEAWKPTTNETSITTLDSDASNWSWDNTATYAPVAKANDTVLKAEGTSSLKLQTGQGYIDANTFAYWKLEETAGTGAYLQDSTANNRVITPWNGATVTQGIVGKARHFDGTDDYLLGVYGITGSSTTVDFWFQTTTATRSVLFGQSNRGPTPTPSSYVPAVLMLANGTIRGELFTGAVGAITSTKSYNDGKWHHLVLGGGGGSQTLFIDGETIGTRAGTLSQTWWSHTTIGTGYDTISRGATADAWTYFNGDIDEVRLSSATTPNIELEAEAFRLSANHAIQKNLTSTDLSGKDTLPFYIAADRPGTYLEVSVGESTYSNSLPDANTVGLWHFEEKNGSGAYFLDASGNGKPMTPQTGVTSLAGKMGNAIKTDATSEYLTISPITPASSYTISAWSQFPLNNTGSYRTLVQLIGGTYHHIIVDSTGILGVYNSTFYSSGFNINTLSPGWHQIVAVASGSSTDFYIDGQKVGTSSTKVIANISAFGNHSGGGQHWGAFDEIAISNVARTADEVRQVFEKAQRSHPITIEFGASLDTGNLITGSGDTSFTIDATTRGLNSKGSKIYPEEKIIVRENNNGTEYSAQATVTTVNSSTGAITTAAWDTGSTFPSGGYTVNADVFKWQREYWDITNPMDDQVNAVTNLSLRITDGNEGRTIWLDDIRSANNYLTTPTSSSIASTAQRYFQYRAVINSRNQVSPSLSAVNLAYTQNSPPGTPVYEDTSLVNKVKSKDSTPNISFTAIHLESADVVYELQWDTNANFSTASSAASDTNAGFVNLDNGGDTSPFTSGDSVSYTWQSVLTNGVTYFYRVRGKNSAGGVWSDWSETRSLTIDTSLTNNAWYETHADQFASDTLDPELEIDLTNHLVQHKSTLPLENADSSSNWASSDPDLLNVTAESTIVQAGSGSIKLSPNASWWNSSWTKRVPITVANTAGLLNGYQVLLSITHDSDMQTDFDDLRFTNASGTELSYWLESKTDSSSALVWVETDSLAASGNTTLYLYYGNSSASTASSIANTFATGIKHFTGSCPNASSYCNPMDNSTDADGIRASYTPSSVSNVTTINDGTGGDDFFRRYRYLFVPNTSGNYSFGVNNDDGGHVGKFNADSYGGGYVTTDTFPTMSTWAYWYGAHGTGTCGTSGSVGTVSLTSGQGYWLDYVMNEIASGQYAQMCIRQGTSAFETVSTSMTNGSVYRREYTSGAEPTSSFGSEEGLAGTTATATIAATDLSSIGTLTFWVRSTRTGSFMSFHMGETTLTEQTTAFSISAANTWEQKSWNISGISAAERNAITKIGLQITDASSTFDLYIDDIQMSGFTNTAQILSSPITASLITGSRWNTFTYSDSESFGNITYKIYSDESGTPTLISNSDLPGNSTGFTNSPVDLSTLSTDVYPILYLGAELSFSGGSPQLLNWQVSFNDPPETPTLSSPANSSVLNTLTPTFQLSTTDTESDYLRYKVELCSDAAMTTSCQTFDQTVSQTNWSGQNAQTSTAYTSGSTATYTYPTQLPINTTYYWRATAIDPGGSNWWSGTQDPVWSFTTPNLFRPQVCLLEESKDDDSIIIRWDDPNIVETGYEVERNLDAAGFSAFSTTAANITSDIDNSVTPNNSYQYRIRALLGASTTDWCTTPLLQIETGNLQLEGVRGEGLQID